MKLKRNEFDPLRLPRTIGPGRGPKGDPDPRKPIDPDEKSDKEEDDDDDGEDESDPRDIEVKVETPGKGKSKNTTDINVDVEAGGMLTPEESKALQEQLGVPVELPGIGDDESWTKEARRHVDKLTQGGEPGSGKGGLRRAVIKLTEPVVDWKSVLKRFIGKAMSSTEPVLGSRRHLYKDDYFYGEKRKYEAMDTAVIAVDTSGSMTPKAIELILSEIRGIIKVKKIKKTKVVYFDDGIQGIDEVGEKSVFDMKKIGGGGGTSFIEPLQVMAEAYKKGKMNLAVFMTDGYANLKLPTPKYSKIFVWVILDNPDFKAPFGQLVVHISQKQMQG
jgi:predicted metal-dependent peptidase